MAKKMLIYENVKQITHRAHADLSIDHDGAFSFCRHVNAMPILLSEFAKAAPEYIIIFAPTEGGYMPAVLLGTKDGENLYLDDKGNWKAQYVPAFARRYPFVFSGDGEGKRFTLCIDESYGGLNREGRGARLFDDQEEHTPYLNNMLEFMKNYQAHHQRTEEYCRLIGDLKLLDEVHMKIPHPSDKSRVLTGLRVVNRDRLKALDDKIVKELLKTDLLEVTFLHLLSLHNASALARRAADHAPPSGTQANRESVIEELKKKAAGFDDATAPV